MCHHSQSSQPYLRYSKSTLKSWGSWGEYTMILIGAFKSILIAFVLVSMPIATATTQTDSQTESLAPAKLRSNNTYDREMDAKRLIFAPRKLLGPGGNRIIPPFLAFTKNRGQATRANFCLGAIPPRAIFGRS